MIDFIMQGKINAPEQDSVDVIAVYKHLFRRSGIPYLVEAIGATPTAVTFTVAGIEMRLMPIDKGVLSWMQFLPHDKRDQLAIDGFTADIMAVEEEETGAPAKTILQLTHTQPGIPDTILRQVMMYLVDVFGGAVTLEGDIFFADEVHAEISHPCDTLMKDNEREEYLLTRLNEVLLSPGKLRHSE